jgi:hypothetical protein
LTKPRNLKKKYEINVNFPSFFTYVPPSRTLAQMHCNRPPPNHRT